MFQAVYQNYLQIKKKQESLFFKNLDFIKTQYFGPFFIKIFYNNYSINHNQCFLQNYLKQNLYQFNF